MDARRLSPHRRGQLAVALAAVAWSTAGLFQRELTMDTVTQLGGRALFALLALLVYVSVAERGGVIRSFRSVGLRVWRSPSAWQPRPAASSLP